MSNAPQIVLRSVGLIGAFVFASVLILTFVTPTWVEDYGATFIERESQERIDATIDSIGPPEGSDSLSVLAKGVYEKNAITIEASKEALRSGAHTAFAAAIAEARNLDCECREKWEDAFESGYQNNIQLLQAANDRIVEFIQSTYLEVVAKLKTDIRIFSSANLLLFVLMLLVSWMKPQAIKHLFVPGILMAVTTVICSYFYIFEQDWLLTIIYSNYVGLYYLFYLGVVFGFLCDIVLNRARITTEIANSILNSIGSIQLSPC